MARIERNTKRYPTDLTDEEWLRIEPALTPDNSSI
jgi:transposase